MLQLVASFLFGWLVNLVTAMLAVLPEPGTYGVLMLYLLCSVPMVAAGDESCVIIGRCADYVLYNDPNCFRIFIHARPDARIGRTMAKFGLEYGEAKRQMENTDRSRAQHYRHFTGREYGKQEYYHLSVDSGMLGTEESVEVILDVIRRWCRVRGTHPLSSLDIE